MPRSGDDGGPVSTPRTLRTLRTSRTPRIPWSGDSEDSEDFEDSEGSEDFEDLENRNTYLRSKKLQGLVFVSPWATQLICDMKVER